MGKDKAQEMNDILSNPQLYDLLVARITCLVHDEIQKRTARVRSWAIGIATVVVGFAIYIGSIIVEREVAETVSTSLDVAIGNAQYDVEVAALDLRTFRLTSNWDRDQGFTDDDAEYIISEIELLHSRTSDFTRRGKLLAAVEAAIETFFNATRFDYVKRVADAAPSFVHRSDTVLAAVVQMSGLTLIGDPGGPASWGSDGPLRGTHDQYVEYIQLAKDSRHEELYLFYEFMLGHIEGRPFDELYPFVEHIGALEERDKEFLKTVFRSYGSGRATKAPASERVAGRTLAAMCEFIDYGFFQEMIGDLDHKCPDTI